MILVGFDDYCGKGNVNVSCVVLHIRVQGSGLEIMDEGLETRDWGLGRKIQVFNSKSFRANTPKSYTAPIGRMVPRPHWGHIGAGRKTSNQNT